MSSKANKAAKKAEQKEQDALNVEVATAARELELRLNENMVSEANCLGVDVSALCAWFLMYASHHCDTQPTVWNSLVHVKSEEWAEMKDLYPSPAFLAYVVEHIHSENLYNIAEMSEKDQDQYICAAQDACTAKLNAGVSKTTLERFTQGTVKNKIVAICQRLSMFKIEQ
ncbi:hypothetical protein BN14_06655 [Rhizoctonia solani AG-1 IB]|uniref:Uncharacterized protein n=1 Tax=Thanatephorus cucumeris (strain AG1-IB / isolate 7/3/14) TaxID=1108050 RepID=M5C9T7_THACB|nr:hypothetical protein BN14_06655 [Rhizoctonia solani AG-1 IB]